MRHKDKIRDMESLLLSYVKSMFSVSHDLLTTVSDKISQMAYSELSLKEQLSGKRNRVLYCSVCLKSGMPKLFSGRTENDSQKTERADL